MPITKQAIKKLARDRLIAKKNASLRERLRDQVKHMRKTPTKKALSLVFSALDKAAKRHIIHANKAARLKSRLSRLLQKK